MPRAEGPCMHAVGAGRVPPRVSGLERANDARQISPTTSDDAEVDDAVPETRELLRVGGLAEG
eukprot:14445220-Alexandrium_andersonii.AAC.1